MLSIRSLMPLALTVAATATAAGQSAVIPSRLVKVVEFADRDRLYRVDLETGKVTFTDSGNVQPVPPAPTPTPTPDVKPKPVPSKALWMTIIVAPYDVAQRELLDDPAVRKAAADRGVFLRVLNSTEEDVDNLGFRATVRSATVPCVIIQDKGGSIIVGRKVTGAADVVMALEAAK